MNTKSHEKILYKDLSYIIQGCCFEIRKEYGAGQKESVYVNLLKEYLELKGLMVEKEKSIKIYSSKSGKIVGSYRPDLIVEEKIPIEVKSSIFTTKQNEKQLYHYLRNSNYELGYLINFSTKNLFIKRIIYTNDRKPFLKILSCIFVFFFVWFGVINKAQAARLYFDPQELVIGTQGDFSVVVNVDAPTEINTLAVAVKVPVNLVPVDVYNGNSIINLWVDKPSFDEASRLLTFSGIIPGGFAGESAPLLIIKFKVKEGEDKALLSFNKEETKVFLHTPDGIEDTLELIDLPLPIIKGKENLRAEPPDDDPPESFLPMVAQDPTIWEGKYFLVFATQDKGSGIGHYEVCEGSQKNCVVAESPYLLQNQELDQKIFVKVFDKSGNERIAMLPAQKPRAWYENYSVYVIIILSLIVFRLLWKILRRKKYPKIP